MTRAPDQVVPADGFISGKWILDEIESGVLAHEQV
jgi:hypothetical protein